MNATVDVVQQRIEECQGLVRRIALQVRRKLPPNVELDDLIAYGQVGLAEAARDYDPLRGNRFSTYAYYRVRGAVYDGLGKMAWFGRSDQHRVRYEHRAGDVLENDADAALLPVADEDTDFRWFRNLSRSLAIVHFLTAPDDSCDGAISLSDSGRFAPPQQAIEREIRQKLHELIDRLPQEEGELIRAVYFEGLTLQDAGRRLGISKSWATRLHARALERLARSLKRLLGLTS